MKNIIIFILMFFINGCTSQSYKEENIPGNYRSISESEWEVEVRFYKDGTGKIIKSNWEAGKEIEKAEEEIFWKKNGRDLQLSTNKNTLFAKYVERLSLESVGRPGSLPAIMFEGKDENKELKNVILWKY